MTRNFGILPVVVILLLCSAPLAIMYLYLVVDTFSNTPAGSLIPNEFTLEHWRFLIDTSLVGNVWMATFNSLLFAVAMVVIVLTLAATGGYAVSRLNLPFRRFFLAGILVMHAFPAVTLIIGTFLVLNFAGLYNSLIGVIVVKATFTLPFGIWIMKGFYDAVPWEIEMSGVQDGASRRIQLETGISAILVTHDQVEAMSMCDRIAIMNRGEIVQVAKPDEMYRSPVNQFVAGFLGNPPIAFVHGRSEAGVLHTEGGLALPLPDRLRGLEGRKLTVGVRPEHFGIDGDVRVAGKVSFVEPQGRETLFDVRLADGSVLRSVQASREDVKIGDEVTWPIRIDRLLVFDEMGSRL